MVQHLKIAAIALIITLFGSSCTREDLSRCESSLLLSFHYTYNSQNEDLFLSSIENIELFVYDRNSMLVQNCKIGKFDLTEGNKYRLSLNEGAYKIVAHGEVNTSYVYNRVETYHTAYVSAKRESGNQIPAQINNLFHAMVEQVTIDGSKEQQQQLFFIKNSNHIRVIVKQPQGAKATMDATCAIHAINGDYKFDNTIYGSDRVHYIPTPLPEASDQTFDFTVLRLWSNDDSQLVVRDHSQVLYDGSLSELLLRKPGTDLDMEDDFEIVLTRNAADNTVKITVDGWEVIDHNSGL